MYFSNVDYYYRVVMRIIAFDTLSILKEQLKIQVWIL